MNKPKTYLDSRSIQDRGRPPNAAELAQIEWLKHVEPEHRARAEAAIVVAHAQPGEIVCKVGRPATFWLGLVYGLLKMSNDVEDGTPFTFTGVAPGGWFGEGTLLKRESYRYNIQALRESMLAGVTIEDFHWLLESSIGFNRFVLNQINERLSQFIGAREIDRMDAPEMRVARSLASLFNPVLFPSVGDALRITQQELAYLVGLSRQRTNEALQHLDEQGVIRSEYGGLRVNDLDRLRAWRGRSEGLAA
jgi:CRP/FNR family transcriptional regulator, cyclic AMP receptor protein